MRQLTGIIVWACGILVTSSLAQTQGWRGIAPLSSTRADVERLIGRQTESNGITYALKNERVNVRYSSGKCANGQAEWNVPPGTVTSVIVYPQTDMRLDALSIDLSRFDKVENPREADSVFYNNNDEGISIRAGANGAVFEIEYFPARKYSHLRCPAATSTKPSLEQLAYYLFDEFSNRSSTDEKARLDNFAAYLLKNDKITGYIVIYSGGRFSPRQARLRAKRAKDRFVTVNGIATERVVTIVHQRRGRKEVELYAVPKCKFAGPC